MREGVGMEETVEWVVFLIDVGEECTECRERPWVCAIGFEEDETKMCRNDGHGGLCCGIL